MEIKTLENLHKCIKTYKDGCLLRAYIIAGSQELKIVGTYGSPLGLKIKLKAIPEKGKANKELLKFLGKFLGVSSSQLSVVKGETHNIKEIYLPIKMELVIDKFKSRQ